MLVPYFLLFPVSSTPNKVSKLNLVTHYGSRFSKRNWITIDLWPMKFSLHTMELQDAAYATARVTWHTHILFQEVATYHNTELRLLSVPISRSCFNKLSWNDNMTC